MPEKPNILQENATQRAPPASAYSELPSVGSACAWSGNLSHRAWRSPQHLRAVLAAIASVTAVAALVFFCSRVYERRALLARRSRKLASSEVRDAPFEICENDGEEVEQTHNGSRLPNDVPGSEWSLPLKKRLLVRVAESGAGGDWRNPQQQEQQYFHEASTTEFVSPESSSGPSQEQFGLAPFPIGNPPSSGHLRMPSMPDAAAGQVLLDTYQYPAGHSAQNARKPASREERKLQPRRRRSQRKLEIQHRHHQPQQPHLQEHLHVQQQHMYWQHLPWQQQRQQQETILQQLLERKQQQVMQDHVQQQAVIAKEQAVAPQVELEEVQDQGKRERRQEGELEILELEQRQPLRPADPLSRYVQEDEWIDSSPRHETSEPRTHQLAMQSSAAVAATSSLITRHTVQVSLGLPLASSPPSREHAVDAAVASASMAGAARAAAAPGFPYDDPACSTSTTREGREVGEPIVSSLQTPDNIKDEEATVAGNSAIGGAVFAMPATAQAPAGTELPETPNPYGPVTEHPYVHLPLRIVEKTPTAILANLKCALVFRPCRRDVVPLLQKAHDLLSRRFLELSQMRDLARVARKLMRNAAKHQHQDMSKQPPSTAVERLGLRFLMLDVVVSTFIVLGYDADPGVWKTVTDAISHAAPPLALRGRKKEELQTFNTALGQELSKAIQTLKTGSRPDPACLLYIKRMLFCSPEAPRRFKAPDFDRWRKDDMATTSEP
ncbi:hypothetical protein EMWEY_00015020 [Eimeria maxima]|uniref:Transmembrane protein n=1 Tax=Eimeria maxima TaxID=5804 RepID=U6M243_EIMMA|nr:hypothetical protein EMWEY_00015020 [Eimeria maxima]CDJ58312.1 hypothetical protein EMWEY_00015020 [Eimeria maxima]